MCVSVCVSVLVKLLSCVCLRMCCADLDPCDAFRGNELGAEGAAALAPSLREMTGLKQLDLM